MGNITVFFNYFQKFSLPFQSNNLLVKIIIGQNECSRSSLHSSFFTFTLQQLICIWKTEQLYIFLKDELLNGDIK